jgi:hypothetical protein
MSSSPVTVIALQESLEGKIPNKSQVAANTHHNNDNSNNNNTLTIQTSVPKSSNCSFWSYFEQSCLNGKCDTVQREYRQCDGKPKEKLVIQNGEDKWLPVSSKEDFIDPTITGLEIVEKINHFQEEAEKISHAFSSGLGFGFQKLANLLDSLESNERQRLDNTRNNNHNRTSIQIDLDSSDATQPIRTRTISTTRTTTHSQSGDKSLNNNNLSPESWNKLVDSSHSVARKAVDSFFKIIRTKPSEKSNNSE